MTTTFFLICAYCLHEINLTDDVDDFGFLPTPEPEPEPEPQPEPDDTAADNITTSTGEVDRVVVVVVFESDKILFSKGTVLLS